MDEDIRGLSMNQSINGTHHEGNNFVFDDYAQRIIVALLFAAICIVGTIGNSVVILAIVLHRKLRSTTNWFVLNLACTDLLTCLCLPFHAVTLLDKTDRIVPELLCTSIAAVWLISSSESLIMLALIGFTRWFLITRPMHQFKKLYRKRNIIISMIVTWVYSTVWVITPHFVGLGKLGFSNQFKVCQWDTSMVPFDDFYSRLGGFGVFAMFVIVAINYLMIYHFVASHNKKIQAIRMKNIRTATNQPHISAAHNGGGPTPSPGAGDQSPEVTQQFQTKGRTHALKKENHNYFDKKKAHPINKQTVTVTKRLAVVVFAFFICFMPFGISTLVTSLRPIVPWTFLIYHLSNCINPFIYARTMPAFRTVMGNIIRCHHGNV